MTGRSPLSQPRALVVAEIGCNHQGNMKIAEHMINLAAAAGADFVKFQKRDIDNQADCNPSLYLSPHPVQEHSFGRTYEAHRRALELDPEQHRKLMRLCISKKVGYACSVWDIPSALLLSEMMQGQSGYIKVPSACNLNFDLMEVLIKRSECPIHVSTGMSTRRDIHEIAQFFMVNDAMKRLVLYACTSDYPTAPEDVCTGEVSRLKEIYGPYVRGIGFSGHHIGITQDIVAQTLGATWVERHFTFNRRAKGTDHSASLEHRHMRDLCDALEIAHISSGTKPLEGYLPCEDAAYQKLKAGPVLAPSADPRAYQYQAPSTQDI